MKSKLNYYIVLSTPTEFLANDLYCERKFEEVKVLNYNTLTIVSCIKQK